MFKTLQIGALAFLVYSVFGLDKCKFKHYQFDLGNRGWMEHPHFCHWVKEREPDDGPSYPRRTVVPTTDCRWVHSKRPNTPLSNFTQVSSNGHMPRTVIHTTVRPTQSFWLLETLFLRVSLYFSMCPQTDKYDRPSYPRRSVLMTVMMVRDPSPKGLHIFSKCAMTDTYNGPSYLWRSVLHIPSYLSETLIQGSPSIHSLRKTRRTPWRSVIVTTSRHQARRVSLSL